MDVVDFFNGQDLKKGGKKMFLNAKRRSFLRSGLFFLFIFFSQNVQADLITGSQEINGHRDSGPYSWDYSYTRGFDGEKLYKHVEIDFIFDDALGWGDAEKSNYKTGIETGIESVWNNKYYLMDNETRKKYPLVVDVTTGGPFNQTVKLHKDPNAADPNDSRADMLNWYDTDTAVVNAHEFGHMLGLFDEYAGGAVDPDNPALSNDGLMGLGALNANPVMYERYYQQYLDYMDELNEFGDFTLHQTPEPSTAILLFVGLIFFISLRRSCPSAFFLN